MEGEIVGFIGLNGAGKTTTIRVLLDLLRPSAGRALLFGRDCQTDGVAARREVGYLPGELGIYSDLTGREVLDLLAGLNGRPANLNRRRELQDRLELPDSDLRRRLREYSSGMKRKLGILQAFEADPRLLVLDEPTEGLDPLLQEALYGLLADAKRQGRTVFMSSHVLSEVERVCDRIAMLRAGELVLVSAVEESRKLGSRRVRLLFSEDVHSIPALPPGIRLIEGAIRAWTLAVDGVAGPLLEAVAGLPVRDLSIEEPRLEDVVMKYYREDGR